MLNAVGQAQHILLLGGTSEIGLGVVSEFLQRGPATVSYTHLTLPTILLV